MDRVIGHSMLMGPISEYDLSEYHDMKVEIESKVLIKNCVGEKALYRNCGLNKWHRI